MQICPGYGCGQGYGEENLIILIFSYRVNFVLTFSFRYGQVQSGTGTGTGLQYSMYRNLQIPYVDILKMFTLQAISSTAWSTMLVLQVTETPLKVMEIPLLYNVCVPLSLFLTVFDVHHCNNLPHCTTISPLIAQCGNQRH